MKVVLLIAIVIIAALVAIWWLSGGFAPVKPEIKRAGGEIMIYEEMRGSYSQSPQIMNKIYADLQTHGIDSTQGIGYYYDNPKSVAESQLRSEVGEVITAAQLAQVQELGLAYKTKTLPEQEYLIVELPYPNQLAVFIQMIKAYPTLSKYSQDNGMVVDTPVTEIYDGLNKVIIYRKEIVRN